MLNDLSGSIIQHSAFNIPHSKKYLRYEDKTHTIWCNCTGIIRL